MAISKYKYSWVYLPLVSVKTKKLYEFVRIRSTKDFSDKIFLKHFPSKIDPEPHLLNPLNHLGILLNNKLRGSEKNSP